MWIDKREFKLVCVALLLSLILVGTIAVLAKEVLVKPSIVTVDLKALVRDKLDPEFIKQASEAEVKRKVSSLIKEQTALVQAVTRDKNVIVVSKEAVISKVQDITEFIKQLKESDKGGSL